MSSTCSFNYKLFKIFIVVVSFSENKIKVLLKLDDTIHLISNTKESCLCLIKHKLYLVLVLGHILFSHCRFSQELKEIHFSSLSLKMYLREMEIQFFSFYPICVYLLCILVNDLECNSFFSLHYFALHVQKHYHAVQPQNFKA